MQGNHPLTTFRKQHCPPLSKQQLADMLGVVRMTIHRWERGKRKVDPDLLPTVSEKTGIPKGILRPDLAALLSEPEAAE